MGVVKYYGTDPEARCHWGILGQKWGVRRFQNPDGTLTAAGRERYGRIRSDIFDASVKLKNKASKALDNYAAEAKVRRAEEKKQRSAEKAERVARAVEDQQRLQDPDFKRREYLKSKNPKYLTNDELKELNDRKRLEEEFEKNYQNMGKSFTKELFKEVKNEVVKPAAVALGRALVLETFSNQDKFESIMTEQLRSQFGYNTQGKKNKDKNNNQNNNKNNNGNNNQNKNNNGNNNQNKNKNNKNKNKTTFMQKFMATTPKV